MRNEDLSGIIGLFIPRSPSRDWSVACKRMRALVAGADLNQRPLGYEGNAISQPNQLPTSKPKKTHHPNPFDFGLSCRLSAPVHGQFTDKTGSRERSNASHKRISTRVGELSGLASVKSSDSQYSENGTL